MNATEKLIELPVDLTNPGQFFACCGVLELASRLDPNAEGCFVGRQFRIRCSLSFEELIHSLRHAKVKNTMSTQDVFRMEELAAMPKKEREKAGLEEEKKALDSKRREEPVLFQFHDQTPFDFIVDWFRDGEAGGSRFKTWAGQQSVLDIATAMYDGLNELSPQQPCSLWNSLRGRGLPFNFDSELGGQGSALDIGFSFDPLSGNELTRIEGACRPGLEVLSFLGLQRFRPREISRQNRFVYTAWHQFLPPSVAAAVACQSIEDGQTRSYEFRLLYRTKYLKSFLPAIPFQGDQHE